jgi:hypothetical protein
MILAALLCTGAAPAERHAASREKAANGSRPLVSKTNENRSLVSNTEDESKRMVTKSKDDRPLVRNPEKPFVEKVQDGLRDVGQRVGDGAKKAGKAIEKAIANLRK